MKFTIVVLSTVCLLAGGALCNPISVSDNNVGDIVVVGVNVDADIKTDIETNIINVLVAILTHLGDINVGLPGHPEVPEIEAPGTEGPAFAVKSLQKSDFWQAIQNLKDLMTNPDLSNEEKEQIIKQKIEEWIEKLKDRMEQKN